tara:strand:- start:87 stop:452 length:366 start_codon:yes stop_codon:yes gene_type:complete
MTSSPIAPSTLHELCGELLNAQEEQRQDDAAHEEYRARRKARAARSKELRATISDVMAESDLDSFDAGDRVFTRDSTPKVQVNKARVLRYLGPDAFQEYSDANVDVDDSVRVKKKAKRGRA